MNAFLRIGKFLIDSRFTIFGFFPIIFSTLMTFIQFFAIIFEAFKAHSFMIAFKGFARIFALQDYNIYHNVNIFINSPDEFGIFNMMIIFSSLMLMKFIIIKTNWLVSIILTNSSIKEGLGTTFISLVIWGIIETSAVIVIFGQWVVPYAGVFLLLFNFTGILVLFEAKLSKLKELIVQI